MAESTHSLYPMCQVEMRRRSDSLVSDKSDHKSTLNKSMALSDRSLNKDKLISTHSLYPTCRVETRKRSDSLVSGHSDFASRKANIPLVDLDKELALSVQSMNSEAENDKLLSVSLAELTFEERNRSVSEVIVERNVKSSPDSGSDSGFSDPSSADQIIADDSGSSSRKSPLSDVDSLDIVPSLPQPSPGLASPSPKAESKPTSTSSSATPSPTHSNRSSTRKAKSRGGSSVNVEEIVTVLSEERVNVVDGAKEVVVSVVKEKEVKTKKQVSLKEPDPEVYMPASRTRTRDEYIPPRSNRARTFEDDEDDINKGCYYFMACLDTFWIL